ncbi:ribonuclease HII [Oceanobacillus senegalensis]|uniref:ribonuclease HII n=1 Tax=Oceanobacillus senegalensis TaxID=1936063 RepID=UPI000A308845|nr:ribonuclease HII [Oceanobacillus senegalensis]
MKRETISDLKRLFQNGQLHDEMVQELKKDDRKGVQKIVQSYEKQKQKEAELEIKFEEMCQYEHRANSNGKEFVAGVDEAGRGPLAGPVVAAAVILPRDVKLLGLDDSKQLTEAMREKYFTFIKEHATSYHIAVIDNQTIDDMNIFEATKLAMTQSIQKLDIQPDHALIDAVQLHGLNCTSESIVKGDAKSISIAAASILAKVTRDRLMKEIHNEYPEYDFASNMGYGTKFHMAKLEKIGVTPYHRKSFAPVKNVLKGREERRATESV